VALAAADAPQKQAASQDGSDDGRGQDRAATGGALDLQAAPGSPAAPAFQLTDAAQPAPQGAQLGAQTVSRLAADLVKKLQARTTRFQVALQPAGLGRVDVNIRIGADGAVAAALNFDNPQAAEALKARAGELRTALEQAGFQLSGQDLSFTSGGFGRPGDTGSGGQRPFQAGFTSVADAAEAEAAQAELIAQRASAAGGVDLRI
jgi:flagellar hook-length control protein FliK